MTFRSAFAAVLLVFLGSVPAGAAIPASERDALLALFDATGGPQWKESSGWRGAAGSECQWDGILCDDTGSNVRDIELGSNNLTGTIPVQVRDLREGASRVSTVVSRDFSMGPRELLYIDSLSDAMFGRLATKPLALCTTCRSGSSWSKDPVRRECSS